MAGYLTCPSCGSDLLCVRDRRGTWRRRECRDCSERFSTRETIVSSTEPKHRARFRGQLPLTF
jgi:transcriptional regulator NrdR family protein